MGLYVITKTAIHEIKKCGIGATHSQILQGEYLFYEFGQSDTCYSYNEGLKAFDVLDVRAWIEAAGHSVTDEQCKEILKKIHGEICDELCGYPRANGRDYYEKYGSPGYVITRGGDTFIDMREPIIREEWLVLRGDEA